MYTRFLAGWNHFFLSFLTFLKPFVGSLGEIINVGIIFKIVKKFLNYKISSVYYRSAGCCNCADIYFWALFRRFLWKSADIDSRARWYVRSGVSDRRKSIYNSAMSDSPRLLSDGKYLAMDNDCNGAYVPVRAYRPYLFYLERKFSKQKEYFYPLLPGICAIKNK